MFSKWGLFFFLLVCCKTCSTDNEDNDRILSPDEFEELETRALKPPEIPTNRK